MPTNQGYIKVYRINTEKGIGSAVDSTSFYDPITHKVVTLTQGGPLGKGSIQVQVNDFTHYQSRQEKFQREGHLVEISGYDFHRMLSFESQRKSYDDMRNESEKLLNAVMDSQRFHAAELLRVPTRALATQQS